MMRKHLNKLPLLLVCHGLLGCSGGGGGAGTQAVRGPAGFRYTDAFEQRYQEIDRVDLTIDMPRSGSARYSGVTSVALDRGGPPVGQMTGEVEMTVDFAAAAQRSTEGQALSGRMYNFKGQIDGSEVIFAGQLTTSAAKDLGNESFARVSNQIIGPFGPDGPGRIGSVDAQFAGELSTGGIGSHVWLEAGGSFRGAEAAGITGIVKGTWSEPDSAEPMDVNGRFVMSRE